MKGRAAIVLLLSASLALTACSGGGTQAAVSEQGDRSAGQTAYPEKSVQFIIPYAAGGGTDALMRLLTAAMEQEWGQSLIAANKAGGLGQVGLTELAAAKTDGYTIGALSNLDHILVLLTGEHVSYTYDSFDYLGAINMTANVLMASGKSGFESLEDLVAYARERPGEVTVAVSGKTHIAEIALFEKAAGIKLTTVMQDGGGDSLNAVLGGHVDCAVLDKKFVGQADGQGVNTLATFSGDRVDTIPDIVTMKELGYNVATETYRVIAAPAGTPEDIKKKITDTMKTVTDEKFQKSMGDMSEIYRFLDRNEVKKRLDADYKAMEELLIDNPDAFSR